MSFLLDVDEVHKHRKSYLKYYFSYESVRDVGISF